MRIGELLLRLRRAGHRVEVRSQRLVWPDARRIIFDARTAMEYAMMAPLHRRLLADPRVRTYVMSSDRPERAGDIFREAPPDVAVLSPRVATLKRFDAYVAAHFVWATLPRGTCRVQMFHGVAGKFGREYDRPCTSMRHWDRLFFINRRRLNNYIASGAIDRDSSAIRLVGMPKSDSLVDGTFSRNAVLERNGMDPSRTTVLYAPTWTRFSSLNAMGEEVVAGLVDAGYQVLVKLHDLSRDRTYVNSGGVDWVGRLTPILAKGHGHLITSADASPWLVAADALITDHSSIGFEYLLLDRPVVRIAMPELIKRADIPDDYVQLLAAASTTVETASDAVVAVAAAVARPALLSDVRRALAAELFHAPGGATTRAVEELYSLMELDPPLCQPVVPAPAVACAVARTVSQ